MYANLLLVDHASHAALAVVAGSLGAVVPDRVLVGDREGKDVRLWLKSVSLFL
jgi:hypothetical protein